MTSPAADEAGKLVEALQGWLSGALPLASGDEAECRICPLCQAIRAVRGLRPEVVEHLAAATAELTAALRAAAATAPDSGQPASRVEKIDIE